MLDLDNIRFEISATDLLKVRSEEDIYSFFCPDFPKRIMHSPFRPDPEMSFGFYQKNGRWKWKDLGGNGEGGNVFEFVKKAAESRGVYLDSFADITNYIQTQMKLEPGIPQRTHTIIGRNTSRKVSGERSLIQAVPRRWTAEDLKVWKRWSIDAPYLKLYNTKCAQQIWSQKPGEEKELVWIHKVENPIYFYHFPRSKHIKAYRPLETNRLKKWRANIDNLTDIQGYWEADIKRTRPRILVLTKAMKEIMFLRSFGIFSMAINGENHYFEEDFIRHLRKYCGCIVSLYDNDRGGWHGAWELRKTFGIPALFVPRSWGAKNVTDLWEIDYKKCYSIIKYISRWSPYTQYLEITRGILSKAKSIEIAA